MRGDAVAFWVALHRMWKTLMHFKCAAKISGVRSRFNDTASYIDIRDCDEGETVEHL